MADWPRLLLPVLADVGLIRFCRQQAPWHLLRGPMYGLADIDDLAREREIEGLTLSDFLSIRPVGFSGELLRTLYR